MTETIGLNAHLRSSGAGCEVTARVAVNHELVYRRNISYKVLLDK